MAEHYEMPYKSIPHEGTYTTNTIQSSPDTGNKVVPGYIKTSSVLIMFVVMSLVVVGACVIVFFATKDQSVDCNCNIVMPDKDISTAPPCSRADIANNTTTAKPQSCPKCNVTERCADGWQTFQTSCYLIGRSDLTFIDAQDFCQRKGANLVHVNTELENLFMKDLLSQLKNALYWNGLTDEQIEGAWRWSDNGENVKYTDWYTGEPNNAGDEDCVLFRYEHNYKWADVKCTNAHRPICEKQTVTHN